MMISEATLSIPALGATGQRSAPIRDAAIMRAVDVIVSLTALILLAPLLLVISLLVLLTDPGPIVFRHQRIGMNGRMFPCLKFRTMCTDSQERLAHLLASDPACRVEWELTHKLRNDPRITPIGGLLRRSSLDELPQLFNVLRGQMSLVGPRPIVIAEAARYGRYIRDYCSVRPGITGLWQISGRSDTSYRRRVALDTAYTRAKSLGLDLRILFATIPAVIAARGSC